MLTILLFSKLKQTLLHCCGRNFSSWDHTECMHQAGIQMGKYSDSVLFCSAGNLLTSESNGI